jgi:hypothetical protein
MIKSLNDFFNSQNNLAELQIIFYFKEYLPHDFEIKGYFAF